MSNDLVERALNGGLDSLMGDGPNPFEQYAQEEGVQSDGFIRHSGKSGGWTKTGNEVVDNGTVLAMMIMEAEVGFIGWSEGKPIDQRYVKIMSKEPRIKLEDLPPIEKKKSSDGWAEVIRFPVRDLDGSPQMTLTEKAEASYRPIKKLVAAYGENIRMQFDKATKTFKIPLVEIGSEKVDGKAGTYYKPTFKITDWVTEAALAEMLSDGEPVEGAPEPEPEVVKEPVKPAAKVAGRRL